MSGHFLVAAFDDQRNHLKDFGRLNDIDILRVDESDITDFKLPADFGDSFGIIGLDGLVVVSLPGETILVGPALLGLVVLRRRKNILT